MLKHFMIPDAARFDDDLVDNGHQSMLDALNRCVDALDGKIVIGFEHLFADIKTVMLAHFAEEEAFMQSIDYPELRRHSANHRSIVEKCDALVKGCVHKGFADTQDLIALFQMAVHDWLREDLALKTYALKIKGTF